MRTIIGNIKILADENYANETLEFVLCDLYGNKLSNIYTNMQIATKKTTQTDDQGNFKIVLYETEISKIPMFYKMIFKNNNDIDDIKLFVQQGTTPIDFLKLLLPMPKLEMFYQDKNLSIVFEDMVVELFDRFFVSENIFINNDENNLLQEYVKYANSIRNSELMQKLDHYLATIKWSNKNEQQ